MNEQRWHKWPDEKPGDKWYLVYLSQGDYEVMPYHPALQAWICGFGELATNVTHWCELPEPPEKPANE